MRSILSAFAMVALMVGAVAAFPAGDEKKVDITKKGYSPDKLDAKVGDKVTWTNTTDQEHSVTGKAAGVAQEKPTFDSGPIKPGGSWSYTFEKAGTYEYHCMTEKTFHGTVNVTK